MGGTMYMLESVPYLYPFSNLCKVTQYVSEGVRRSHCESCCVHSLLHSLGIDKNRYESL